jgi:glycosyltransferase involved in cell wall biosynthesis
MTAIRLLLVTDAVGGVWVYSHELARALRPLGVETTLAVTGPSPSPEQREAAAGIRLVDTGLPLEWLDTSAAQIASAGKELARIAAREGADIVQTSSAALLAAGAFDQPCVAVQHSCVATWWEAVKGTRLQDDFRWRRDLTEAGLKLADAVVAPSNAFAAATTRTYGVPALAVHNGRTPRKLRPLPQGDFVFTAARLWDAGKNVAVLDRAAAMIDAPVQAAGPTRGPNGASVTLDKVVTLGELSETKLAGVLAAKPIFASAALYEPFGLSVLEAAQSGCALVLSDIPTHREMWGGAAAFVDPRDGAGFAEAIGQLLRDRAKRERLGNRAATRARHYSPERMARSMAQIYVSLADPRPQLIAGAA